MRILVIAVGALQVVAPAWAGPPDGATFLGAPAIGEAGLLAVAVATGIAGIRMVNRYRKK